MKKGLIDNNDISIRETQDFHRDLDKEKRFDTDIVRNIAYLTAEVGEAMNAIRALKSASTEPEIKEAKRQVSFELADCLAYIAKLANYADVDLQEAYREKMKINSDRSWN
jgi:NTP pyrophosphatase (non-canonical NTP hydrolase)